MLTAFAKVCFWPLRTFRHTAGQLLEEVPIGDLSNFLDERHKTS